MKLRALLVAVLAVLVALPSAPAHAAGELGLSPNGSTWGSSLADPLFDPAFRWVPGDVETRSFFVRNQSSDAGFLSVTMLDAAVETLLETGDLEVAARVGNGAWTGVETPGPHALVLDEVVRSGEVRRIDVRISFDPASTNLSQAKRLDLRFDVTLRQDTSVAGPGGPTDSPTGGVAGPNNGSGGLPGTGSTLSPALIALAGLLCSAGLALAGFGRRTRERDERQSSHA